MRKLLTISFVLAAACGNKSGSPDQPAAAKAAAPDIGKTDPAKPEPAPEAKPREPEAKMPSDQALAFALGGKIAVMQTMVVAGKADKVGRDLEKARLFADGLGISAPSLPTKDASAWQPIAKELEAKKSKKIAATFVAGYQIDWTIAVNYLGLDPSQDVAEIGGLLHAAEVPESVWSADLAKLHGKFSDDDVGKLEDDVRAYLDPR